MNIIREDCVFILKEAPVCWERLRDSRILWQMVLKKLSLH